MSISLDILAANLARSLKAGESDAIEALLNRALVEPYYFNEGDPVYMIMEAGKTSGKVELLRDLLTEKTLDITLPNTLKGEAAIEALYRINSLFDLTQELFREESTPRRSDVLAVLETVWREHENWRKCAEIFFSPEGKGFGWVDPATTAEINLLTLSPKPTEELKRRCFDIARLCPSKYTTESRSSKKYTYPGPMHDYALYSHLIRSAEKYAAPLGKTEWKLTTAYIFGLGIQYWFENNTHLLEYALFHILDLMDETKKTIMANSLQEYVLKELNEEVWKQLIETCPYLPIKSHKYPIKYRLKTYTDLMKRQLHNFPIQNRLSAAQYQTPIGA